MASTSTEPKVRISDCTLRDTRNAPGVFMEPGDVLAVARLLDALGVDEIEIGGGGLGKDEHALSRAVNDLGLKAQTSCLVFCINSEDIEAATAFVQEVGSKAMMISLPSSEKFIEMRLKRSFRAACKLVEKVVGYAASRGISVTFSGEDAARAPAEQLLDYVKAGEGVGAARFRFAESVSVLSPKGMRERIEHLRANTSVTIDVHCHSAFGLGVSNTIAAVEGGAEWVSCTVGGHGERGGNTPLEALVMYLAKFGGRTDFRTEHLTALAAAVARATAIPTSRFAAAVGDDAFLYEKGNMFLHHDAYEAYSPESVGAKRRLGIGKKADTVAVRTMLQAIGEDPAKFDLEALATALQEMAWSRKRCVEDSDLRLLVREGNQPWNQSR